MCIVGKGLIIIVHHTGITYTYGVTQVGWWVLFSTLAICWGIFFPFHYRKFKLAKQFKYIHITTVILGICLPIIPVLVQIKDGYHIAESPTIICIGRDVAATFYAFLLPFNILSAITTTLMVLLFWKILKVLQRPGVKCLRECCIMA